MTPLRCTGLSRANAKLTRDLTQHRPNAARHVREEENGVRGPASRLVGVPQCFQRLGNLDGCPLPASASAFPAISPPGNSASMNRPSLAFVLGTGSSSSPSPPVADVVVHLPAKCLSDVNAVVAHTTVSRGVRRSSPGRTRDQSNRATSLIDGASM